MPYKNKEDEAKAKKRWYGNNKKDRIAASARHRKEKENKVIALKNRPYMI